MQKPRNRQLNLLYHNLQAAAEPAPWGPAVWLAAADMGFGHLRAIHPLRNLAHGGTIILGRNDGTTPMEERLWKNMTGIYERFSRARRIPLIGKGLFQLLNAFLEIPSFYPMRNLSRTTFQVRLLESLIARGLCSGFLSTIGQEPLPLVTSFYAAAIAADRAGFDRIYCIVCDADLNRVWVARDPSESGIIYFAPCGKAAQRLRSYGVQYDRIKITGFPLPHELLGGKELPVLKSSLARRLRTLDPKNRFWPLHRRNVEYFLGADNCHQAGNRQLTITYTVGGAGAQKDIGGKIASSLRRRLANGEVRLNLVAGTKPAVRDYFEEVRERLGEACARNIFVVHGETLDEYFDRFNETMRETDILWTKPSELSFYCGLGIPVIISPAIGPQEYFNRRWLTEIQAGIRQENPEFTDQWLYDFLDNGRFAEAAWAGFLKARKLGTYKILEILRDGTMTREDSPLLR